MAYTKSAAITGAGTILSIGATPTPVAEIKSIKVSGRKWDTDDVTNMSSPGYKEFISTIIDPGEWALEGNRVSGDAGQAAMEAAFASGALTAFTVQLPVAGAQKTKGDCYTFNALVTEIDYSFETTKADSMSCKLKVSGAITLAVGS
jgi:hypothetical protein